MNLTNVAAILEVNECEHTSTLSLVQEFNCGVLYI